MAAAEDRVLQYLAENPGASLVDISNAIVAFGADLNTVADMVGVPRAEAQAAFAPTIDTVAQQEAQRQAEAEAEAEAQRQAQIAAEAEAQRQAQIAAEAQRQAEAEAQRQAQIAAQQAEAEAQRQAEAEAQRQAQIAAQQAEAQRISDLYGNVSGADGFDQSEVDFVTQLINSGQVDVGQVARDFGLPTDVVQSVYDTETQRQVEIAEKAEIERLTQNQAALESLSPADTATISSPSLPDATYTIPGFSLPDYRYNDTSSSSGSSSGGAGGSLTNYYVTAVEPARSGPEGYTGPSISALPPGGGLGPNESSLGNTTLDRGIGGGGSFVDGNSSTFVQDLIDQDAREERQDQDYQDYLAGLQAQEDKARLLTNAASAEGGFDEGEIDAVTALLNSNAVTVEDVSKQFDVPINVVQAAFDANKPVQSTQAAYDAILEASAAIDTGGEYADELYRLNSAIDNKTKEGFGYAKQAAYGVDPLGKELTPAQIAAAERAATDALDTKNTLVDERNTLFESGVEAGIIETPGFLESLKDTGLEGLSNVLGAGTRGIYNVASNIPVVGGYLGDSIEGVAGWLKNMEGVVSYNPITGAVQGTWGDLFPWMDTQTVTQIGNIPGSQTTAGVSTGTILDDFISIGRGEQDIEDVLENRAEQAASILGIDPKILAAAAAAGMSVKDYLEAQKPKQTTLGTTTEGETEAGVKPVAVDLGGGPNKEGGEEEDIVDTLTEAQEKEKNLATATQVFEDAGGGADGVQAVLDTLKENDLTVADLADLTGLNETDINAFIDTTLGDGADAVDTLTEAQEKEKNLATATQVFEDAGGGAEGVQAVLDTLKENDLTVADLADLTGVSETDINTFIDTTLGGGDTGGGDTGGGDTVETVLVETPVVETPVVETPVVETPVVETPVVETPVVETPVVETPVVETPVVETPVVETPVVETPVVETPVVETPVVETPVVETPVVETPVVETPVVETPVVETPVVETPVVETPVVETPVVETPVVETPVVETPVVKPPEPPEEPPVPPEPPEPPIVETKTCWDGSVIPATGACPPKPPEPPEPPEPPLVDPEPPEPPLPPVIVEEEPVIPIVEEEPVIPIVEEEPVIPIVEEEPVVVPPSGGGDGGGIPQQSASPTGGMRGVATEQAGVADISNMYDPSLSFAENMERVLGKTKQTDAVDSALMYGGGIVQTTDLNNELLRIIEGR
jgi:hypothetical protein